MFYGSGIVPISLKIGNVYRLSILYRGNNMKLKLFTVTMVDGAKYKGGPSKLLKDIAKKPTNL